MMIFKKAARLLSLFLCIFGLSITAKASSATLSLKASNSVYVGNQVEVILSVGNLSEIEGGIQTIGSKLVYDSTYLEFVSSTSLAPYTIQYIDKSKKLAGMGMGNNITSSTNLIKLVFKTKTIGNTAIKLNEAELSDGRGASISTNNPSIAIAITPPPSNNANLSNITLSNGALNFNSATTSYNVAVASDVSSININATTEDSGARVTGTGTKNLSYGKNSYNLVVTAASGATKTYTIVINREDNRSNINTLKSLNVTDYKLSPSFNVNTTTYNISVPFEVSSVNVNATPTDEKAQVKISGNTKLAAGKTTNITIIVTAENGTTKNYIIKAKRENDPNKVLATDNNLASLIISNGTLTPDFNKDTTKYIVNVPKDIETINIQATASDKNYAEVDIIGPEKLSGGENKYEIKVTAEDGSTKTYTIIVNKEQDPEEKSEEEPSIPEKKSLDLKSLMMENAELQEVFEPSRHLYHYHKKGDIKIEAIAETEENSVRIIENNGVYTIIVENPEGEEATYTLIPKESNIALTITIIISLILICLGFILGYSIGTKKIRFPKNEEEKTKKSKRTKKEQK